MDGITQSRVIDRGNLDFGWSVSEKPSTNIIKEGRTHYIRRWFLAASLYSLSQTDDLAWVRSLAVHIPKGLEMGTRKPYTARLCK